MQILLTAVTWLIAALLGIGVGLRWLLLPDGAAAEYAITLGSIESYSQVRADIGGAFTAAGLLLAVGLLNREPRLLQAVAVMAGCAATARLVSLFADGFHPNSFGPMVIEILIVAVLVFKARGMTSAPGTEAPGQPTA